MITRSSVLADTWPCSSSSTASHSGATRGPIPFAAIPSVLAAAFRGCQYLGTWVLQLYVYRYTSVPAAALPPLKFFSWWDARMMTSAISRKGLMPY